MIGGMDSLTNRTLLSAAFIVLWAALGTPGHAQVTAAQQASAAEQYAGLAYPASEPPSALFDSPRLRTEYAASYKADLEAILARPDLDARTRPAVLAQLVHVAMVQEDWTAALALIEQLRALQPAPGRPILFLEPEIVAKSKQSGRPLAEVAREVFRGLPWSIAGKEFRESVALLELTTEADYRHEIKTRLDPQAEQSGGKLPRRLLAGLLLRRYEVDALLPQKAALLAESYAYIDANHVEKPDIWPARSMEVSGRRLHPVIIAVWDSGVDMNVYRKQAWRNRGERKNGRDDDGNGFVDDLHGLAFDVGYVRSAAPLNPIGELRTPVGELPALREGHSKMDLGISSADTRRFASRWAAMGPEKKEILRRDFRIHNSYSHGTLMSGIAIAGNPAARLMGIRFDFGGTTRVIEPVTEEVAERFAAAAKDVISHFKRHKVRIANISWGIPLSEVEESLAEVENDEARRKSRAAAIHQRMGSALAEEMRNAPEVLFVGSVGNGGDDVQVEQIFPGMFTLPNLIVAGGTDHTGARLPWSNFGKNVDVYATGWRLPSKVPGGAIMREGAATSQATAYVSNVAGKLLALQPRLKPSEVKRIVKETCDRTEEEGVCLLNPRAAAERARLGMPDAAQS
jgi:hypothetical protein